MASNNPGNNIDDFAVDIEDIGNDALEDVTDIEQGPKNRGSNHDQVSQILSGWTTRKKKSPNNQVRSSGENGDGILSAWGEGGADSQQRNIPQGEPKSKTNWKKALHLPRFKSRGSKGAQDEPEADASLEEEEEHRTFGGEEIEDLDEKIKKWKTLLKSVSNDKTDKHVKRKVNEFLDSQKMKKLE